MLDTMSVRAVDLFLVAIALGAILFVQGLYFQRKLWEKEKEIQDLKRDVATLRDLLTNPKGIGPLTE